MRLLTGLGGRARFTNRPGKGLMPLTVVEDPAPLAVLPVLDALDDTGADRLLWLVGGLALSAAGPSTAASGCCCGLGCGGHTRAGGVSKTYCDSSIAAAEGAGPIAAPLPRGLVLGWSGSGGALPTKLSDCVMLRPPCRPIPLTNAPSSPSSSLSFFNGDITPMASLMSIVCCVTDWSSPPTAAPASRGPISS